MGREDGSKGFELTGWKLSFMGGWPSNSIL